MANAVADHENSILRIELETCGKPGGEPAVKLDLVVTTVFDERPRWILGLLDWQHERIQPGCLRLFTPEARKSFQPAAP
ncbi:MAG: hypothetical protein R3F31_11525 [Verrucomicrobiales bacterium]